MILKENVRWRLVAVIAVVLGLGLGGSLAPTPVQAQGNCEQDECEHGWFYDSCVDNPGQQTGCDMYVGFPYYFCRTYACN